MKERKGDVGGVFKATLGIIIIGGLAATARLRLRALFQARVRGVPPG